jgi:5'-nucleotidase
VTQIDLTLDPKTGDVIDAVADNVIVRTDRFAKNPIQTELIAAYEKLAVPLAKRVVGRIGAPLTLDANPAGEIPLGQVIADAQLAATQDAGAQIALMNPGGIRAVLGMPSDGQVRYEDLFSVQPFYNRLVTMTLTGAQLQQVLEQQWINQPTPRILQVSRGFSYGWDANAPVGQRVVPGSVKLAGQPIAATSRVRITVNGFLASGGDNFTVLKEGEERRTGMLDIDAFELFVRNNPGLMPGPLDRVVRMN